SRHAHGGVYDPKPSPRRKNIGIDCTAGLHYERRRAVQAERDVSAGVVVQAARNPPQRAAQAETENDEVQSDCEQEEFQISSKHTGCSRTIQWADDSVH